MGRFNEMRSGRKHVRSRFNPHRWVLRCINEEMIRLRPEPRAWIQARAMA